MGSDLSADKVFVIRKNDGFGHVTILGAAFDKWIARVIINEDQKLTGKDDKYYDITSVPLFHSDTEVRT